MPTPASARVLVVAVEPDEADQLCELLRRDFEYVARSTQADAAVSDFEAHAPDVIVLAFRTLEQAERYYLALHRFGQSIHRRPHRTVLLCRREDVVAAFDLCKQRFFDDYVSYWPNPQDALRICMSVWLAARELQALNRDATPMPDLRLHANHLEELDRTLTQGLVTGERQAAELDESMQELEHSLSCANDDFSRRLVNQGANGAIEVRDSAALARELALFRTQQLEYARTARERGAGPMSSWAKELKGKVTPALAGTRALASQVRRTQPLLLVIDDDEVMRSILEPVLKSLGYELVLVGSGQQALRELAHLQPDAILMDVRLPDINGIELTRQLRMRPQLLQTPVVLMSGDSRRDTLVHGMDAGAIDFIAKPFSRQILQSKLDKALRRAEQVTHQADATL